MTNKTLFKDLDDKFNLFILFLSLVIALPELQALFPADSRVASILLTVQAIISLYLKFIQNYRLNNDQKDTTTELDL